jgi:hypothetical protein
MIDLTQLSELDPEVAREEIRNIVSGIVARRMSIAEQEELLEDICNDVLGYGPPEPLLTRKRVHMRISPSSGCSAPLRDARLLVFVAALECLRD